uniref:FH2 domain-containing protein 1-like n=1 Tax=Oncorhynchus gorbuscha TaxID=8017 RepID=UPI001EAF3DED|nr:FH2 domain-containing protein 1-like [Oncorhynchus gorbuscha]XP_046175430.1 FH2 domain-containing protein 1-like [Oncorhynchus gorbuscha]
MSLPPASTIPVPDGNKTGPPLPPPPPPPCGPPPPPPPPGAVDPIGGIKKRRVRSFFWKPIPEDQVKGRTNLWTQLPVQQQQYYIDVQTIEELFSQTDCQSSGVTRGGKARGSLRETKDEISILDWKRGMNVGIYLKQFKKSNQDIIEDIRYGNSQSYGAELLKELLKLLPETEEVKKLKAFRGDPSKLSLADSFMFLLTQVPSFEVRIKAMVLREVFPPACENMSRDIDVLRTATKELLDCEELHAILHLVLQAGNILNAGGYAGNAVGFKLSSLLSLADTKANKPGMNLLHFVALEAQKKDDKLLEFPGKLQHVQYAARISVENVDAEFQSLSSRTRSVEESIQEETELLLQLDHFLQNSTAALAELQRERQELRNEGNILIDFFCEDRESFRLDECFKVFQDFCLKFQKAVKDNLERELKEASHRRIQELEEKRHSWASGEEVGGVFGMRSSSSETDIEVALSQEEGLIELLKSRPCSPHSPQIALGRSGSVRRSRGSASAAADRQLTSLLTLGITSDLQVVGGSPNPGRRLWRGAEQRDSSPMRSPETGLRVPNVFPLIRLQTQGPAGHTQLQHQHPQVDWPGPPSSIPISLGLRHQPQPGINSNHSPQTATIDHKPSTDLNPTPDPDNNHNQPSGLTVNLERHTLVPKLRAFDLVLTPHGHDQGDVVTDTDLEEEIPRDSILPETQETQETQEEEIPRDSILPDTQETQEEEIPRDSILPDTQETQEEEIPRDSILPDTQETQEEERGEQEEEIPRDSILPDTQETQEEDRGEQEEEIPRDSILPDTQETQEEERGEQEEEIPRDSILPDTQENSQGSSEGWEQREEELDEKGRMVAAGIVNEEPAVGDAEEERGEQEKERGEEEEEKKREEQEEERGEEEQEERGEQEQEKRGEQQEEGKGVSRTETLTTGSRTDPSPSTAISDLSSHAQSGENHTHTDEAESPTHQVSTSSMGESPANSMPSESQSTNEYSVPVSTTDQSVPVSSDESSVPAVSTSTNVSVTAGASDRSAQGTNPTTSQVSKPSRPPSATTTTSGRKTVIRTLNSSENQGMRRVVPIFKASRCGSIPGKLVEKPPGHQSSGPRTTTTTSSSNPANRSLRRAERSSATPRRSSLQVDDPKAKSVTTTGVHGSARDQPQPSDLQRKPSFRKPLRPVAPRPPPEEKMCRSTLRALAAAGGAVPTAGGGGGNSLSAPPTPSHRGGVSNPTPLPGFARNTAASSFRRTTPPGSTLAPSKTPPFLPCPLSRTLTPQPGGVVETPQGGPRGPPRHRQPHQEITKYQGSPARPDPQPPAPTDPP